MTVIVGAVSYNSLKAFAATTSRLRPVLESQLRKTSYVLKISSARKNEIRDDQFSCVLGLQKKPVTDKDMQAALLAHVGEIVEPVAGKVAVYSAKKAGRTFKIEAVPAMTASSSASDTAVWCTSLRGGGIEYWLQDATMDVSTFLKAFLSEKQLLREGQMLEYSTSSKHEPLLRGWASHGADVKLVFSRTEELPPMQW
jgi:hypothetical protein